MKKLLTFVFRRGTGEDCTNNGLSATHDDFVLLYDCTIEEANQYCEENGFDKDEYLYLNKRHLFGHESFYAEPLVKKPDHIQMFGGNFIYTSDSRFPKVNGTHAPIKIFDRFEYQS